MTVWVILWGDGGYDCTDVFQEVWTDKEVAELRCAELNAKEKSTRSGYYINECELDTKYADDYA